MGIHIQKERGRGVEGEEDRAGTGEVGVHLDAHSSLLESTCSSARTFKYFSCSELHAEKDSLSSF